MGSDLKYVKRVVHICPSTQLEGAPYLTSSEFIFYAEKGQSGWLSVEFYNSLLVAQVMWNRLNNETLEFIQSSDKYNVTVSNTTVNVTFYSDRIQQPGLMVTLEIRNTTVEDFTSYEVHVQNDAGKMSPVTLELRPIGPPDVPHDVHIVPSSITTSSVTIRWVSGFHGGLNQIFLIEYRRQMDDSWAKFPKEISGGMSQNKDFNITVVELNHATLYLFRIYSWNIYKRSEYSTVINATTYADKAQAYVFPVGAVAGGITGVVVAVVLVILVIIFLRRGGLMNKEKGKGDDFTRELQGNGKSIKDPVYANSGAACIPNGGDYEALQVNRNKVNLYQELSDIKNCADASYSFRMNATDTTEKHTTCVNSKETTKSSLYQGNLSKGENKIYENTRVHT